MSGSTDGTWFGNEEDMIITFEEDGANTLYNYEGQVTNITQSGGQQESDVIQCFGNRQITFQKPQDEFELQMDVVFYDTSFDGMFFGNASAAAGTELESNSNSKKFRITIWWAEEAFNGTARTPPSTGEIYRWIFKNCRAVTWEPEIASDDYLKGTITFKTSSVDKDGNGNIFKEWTSAQSTTALTPITGTTTTRYGGTLTYTATTTPAWTSNYVGN